MITPHNVIQYKFINPQKTHNATKCKNIQKFTKSNSVIGQSETVHKTSTRIQKIDKPNYQLFLHLTCLTSLTSDGYNYDKHLANCKVNYLKPELLVDENPIIINYTIFNITIWRIDKHETFIN